MTSTEHHGTTKAFATLRIAGDRLVPEQATRILKIVPTQAYRKGERYGDGLRIPNLTGKTGVWYFCTDNVVAGNRLSDHLTFIERLLEGTPTTVPTLQKFLAQHALHATVSCFWHGGPGVKRPPIPRSLSTLCTKIRARIETDFESDDMHEQRAA